MPQNRNIAAPRAFADWLRRHGSPFPGARIEPVSGGGDQLLRVEFGAPAATYAVAYRAEATPRAREAATAEAILRAARAGALPLVVVPYLSDEALNELDAAGVSGIDLSGNGLMMAPNFRSWRSGQPNRFKSTRPIRNPFQGDSSVFARCFLLRARFDSLNALVAFARERTFTAFPAAPARGLTQGTASRVVAALADELVVGREEGGGGYPLRDARRLLTLLRRGAKPVGRAALTGTTRLSPEEAWGRLRAARSGVPWRAVATGIGSSGHYGALSGVEGLSLYTDDVEAAAALLEVREGRAFANVTLHEERKNVVYFDARADEQGALWASPTQTWLELAGGGPREQEASEALERALLPADPGDKNAP